MEVYVAQFPGAAVKRQISIDGGDQPMWAPDGKQLFYLNGNRLMSVDLNAESGLHPTKPRVLFERAFSSSRPTAAFGDTPRRCLPTASGSCSSTVACSRRSVS